MNTTNDINEKANDILVLRIEIDSLKNQIEEEMSKNEKLQELQSKLEQRQLERDNKQTELLETMRSDALLSWKTEQATFSRTTRKTLLIDPAYKRELEKRLKNGEVLKGCSLKECEYISIRINKG